MATLSFLRRWPVVLPVLVAAVFGCQRQQDPNKIVIWHQMRVDERLILAGQLRQFMADHPGITVEEIYKETEELRNEFIIAAIAGQGPDLVYGPSDMVGPFEVMKIIEPLDTLFSQDFLASFNPKGLTWYKGHLYQIADKLGNHLTLIYNKDLMTTPPVTDLELIEMGKRLTKDINGDGKADQYALTWNYTEPFFFIPFFTGFGGWVMTDDGTPTLDSPAMVNALKFIRDLRDKYRIIPGEADYNIADLLFKDAKSAMIINGDWSWAGYEKAGIRFGVAPLPRIESTGLWCAPMVSPKGFSLNANVRPGKRAILVELVRFLMRADIQLETARALYTMPTRLAAVESDFVRNNEILKNSAIQIEHGRTMPVVPELRAIWDSMRPGYQAVLGGALTPEQAATEMQQLAIQKIKELNE
jgi:arabinogalactan oligomer / maltooligosaccharide transport system substrate-binding protein/arabinogalactan oligomer / maltooligosaccharide transport system permease protein